MINSRSTQGFCLCKTPSSLPHSTASSRAVWGTVSPEWGTVFDDFLPSTCEPWDTSHVITDTEESFSWAEGITQSSCLACVRPCVQSQVCKKQRRISLFTKPACLNISRSLKQKFLLAAGSTHRSPCCVYSYVHSCVMCKQKCFEIILTSSHYIFASLW